jgi:ribosomal protein L37E
VDIRCLLFRIGPRHDEGYQTAASAGRAARIQRRSTSHSHLSFDGCGRVEFQVRPPRLNLASFRRCGRSRKYGWITPDKSATVRLGRRGLLKTHFPDWT